LVRPLQQGALHETVRRVVEEDLVDIVPSRLGMGTRQSGQFRHRALDVVEANGIIRFRKIDANSTLFADEKVDLTKSVVDVATSTYMSPLKAKFQYCSQIERNRSN
jgi:hypothetical protein